MKLTFGRVLALQFAMLSMVFVNSAGAQAPVNSDVKVMPKLKHKGTFKYTGNRNLVPVVAPQGVDPLPPAWFQLDFAEEGNYWTNLGTTATVNPNPPNLPRAYNEYVSRAQGITPGVTVTGFTVAWVSGAGDPDLGSPTVDFVVSFYDGRDDTPTAKAPVAQFLLGFDFNAEAPEGNEQLLSGWTADILLDPVDHFVLPTADFEYGLKLDAVAPGSSVSFGPFLFGNVPGQLYGAPAAGTVGTTFCAFERWAAPSPPTSDYGQFNTATGVHNGGPFWYGDGPNPGDPKAPFLPFAANIFTVYYTPAPSATVDAAYVIHNGYTGLGSNVDAGKTLHKETGTPTALTYSNLINSSRGINGVGFDVTGTANLGAITAADFVFQMSPQGAFDAVSNPPTGWGPAPAPTSVTGVAGTPDKIAIAFANNDIANRWLRVTVKGNANTGLAADEVYYIGHLLGESGPAASPYTVAFADITPIRSGIGATVNSDSTLDIDKNGTVAFADISAMRANVGSQLTNITVP